MYVPSGIVKPVDRAIGWLTKSWFVPFQEMRKRTKEEREDENRARYYSGHGLTHVKKPIALTMLELSILLAAAPLFGLV